MDTASFHKVKQLCEFYGFTQKGRTFFRIAGDGVLQIIKSKHQRSLQEDMIHIGLLSMYDSLQPQWFTASGSMTRYSIVNCCILNNFPIFFAVSMQDQIAMLSEKVLPWLDTVNTQKELSRAIYKLDPRWNDAQKIGPYLACGQHNHAKKVIKTIIGDYAFAQIRNAPKREETIDELLIRVYKEPKTYYGVIEIIDRGETAICSYLKTNYTKNAEYANFCMPKKDDCRC